MSDTLNFNYNPSENYNYIASDFVGTKTVSTGKFVLATVSVLNGGEFKIGGVRRLQSFIGSHTYAQVGDTAGLKYTMPAGRAADVVFQSCNDVEIRVNGNTTLKFTPVAGTVYKLASNAQIYLTQSTGTLAFQICFTDGLAQAQTQSYWIKENKTYQLTGEGSVEIQEYSLE